MSSKKRKGDGKRDGERKSIKLFTTPIATNMIYTKEKRTKQQKCQQK